MTDTIKRTRRDKFAWQAALEDARQEGHPAGDISHATFRVGMAMWRCAGKNGAYPSTELIVSRTGCTAKTVGAAIERLVELGWLECLERRTTKSPGRFDLRFPDGWHDRQFGTECRTEDEDTGASSVTSTEQFGNEYRTVRYSVPSSIENRSFNRPTNRPTTRVVTDSDARDERDEPSAPTKSDAGTDDALFETDPAPAPAPARKKRSAPKTPEHIATTAAYERTGKSFNFIAVRSIAKWAIHDRLATPEAVEECFVGIYNAGRHITKTNVGQWLDGINTPAAIRPGVSKHDAKVLGYLETGERLKAKLRAQNQQNAEQATLELPEGNEQ